MVNSDRCGAAMNDTGEETAALRPVQRQTLAKAVLEQLVNYIQSGALVPGDALPAQPELARRLSVSRPVLREALQGLASLGLIEIRPGSGCYVRERLGTLDPATLLENYSHETALEMLEARLVIEVELAGLAAERATESDLKRMEATLGRIKRLSARHAPSVEATYEFHQALVRAGHNSVLSRMSQLIRERQIAQGKRIEDALPDIAAGEYENHYRLYEAIRRRDSAGARALMREHLEIAHGWEQEVASLRERMVEAPAD